VGAQALERHQMHSEAGAGARAGGALTHRVDGQPRDGAGRRKHRAVGGVGLEGQRGVQVFTALRSSRQRRRASAWAFRCMGFKGWVRWRCCACGKHDRQWAPQVSRAIQTVSHAAMGGRGPSRPSSGIGGNGTPFKTSIPQNKPADPHCVMGFSSTVPLYTDGVANSWREKEEATASSQSKGASPLCRCCCWRLGSDEPLTKVEGLSTHWWPTTHLQKTIWHHGIV
jgi:hypothetical protein